MPVYTTITSKVEYSLLDHGKSLKQMLREFYDWGKNIY